MNRLTTKVFRTDKDYTLKSTCACMAESCADFCDLQDDCNTCGIQMAVNRLAAYEDTGLTPEQIVAMRAEHSGTSRVLLNELLDIKDKRIAELESDNARLRKTMNKMCGLWGENNAN